MEKRGRSIILSSLILLSLLLLILPSAFSSQNGFTTICYDERHSIIDHEMTCEITNDQGMTSNREIKIDLNLKKKMLKNAEIYEFIDKVVPTYEEVCSPYNEEAANGTVYYDNCTSFQNGTETVSYSELERLNTNSASKKVKWSAGDKSFEAGEMRKFLIKWKTGVNSEGSWKINPEGWWNESWERKQALNFSITGNPTNDDFQALTNISYDSDMQSDFSDLRFLNATETGELNYYIDSKVDGAWANVWIRLDQNITTTNQTLAYMYYKNSTTVSSLSNNQTTFNFLDDFDGTLNTSKWTLPTGSCRTSSGLLICGETSTESITGDQLAGGNYMMIHEFKAGGQGIWGDAAMIGVGTGTTVFGDSDWAIFGSNCNEGSDETADESSTTGDCPGGHTKFNAQTGAIIIPNSTQTTFMQGGAVYHTVTTNTPDEAMYWKGQGWAGGTLYIDWVRSRGYNDTIVQVSFGAEIIGDSENPQTTTPTTTPTTPKSNQNISCYATLTDNYQYNITANYVWYKNNISFSSGSKIVENITNELISNISAINTTKGESWICEITPYDGQNYGNATNSSVVTILNVEPTHSPPTLTTLSANHPSDEDLTCGNVSTSDYDGDAVNNVYNWVRDSVYLLSLNLPFDVNANDYSISGNDGTITGAISVSGKVGNAYSFDGDDNITILDDSSIDFTNKKTWEIWFKRGGTGAETVFDKGNTTKSNYKLEFLSGNTLKFSYSLLQGDVVNLFEEDTLAEFNDGTYADVYYNSTIAGVRLTEGLTSGNYTSEVFNASSSAAWNNISWSDNAGAVLTLVDAAEGVYKSTNDGEGWSLVTSDYGGTGSAVEIIESINGTLYIANNREEVWRSTDFGSSWTEQVNDFNGAENSNAKTMVGDLNYLYIIEDDEDVWRSNDSAVTWTKVNDDLDAGTSASDPQGATIDGSGVIYVVADDAQVYKSTDNGTSWSEINSDYNAADGNSATDMDVDSSNNLYILNLQEVWKSTDSGVTWTEISADFNGADGNNGQAMTIDINNFMYIVDSSEDVYRSIDNGVTWTLLVSNVNGASGNVMSIVAYDQPTAKFQVRSCDDSACSGEGFVGPAGTSSDYYLALDDLNVTDNQFFQYITFFETYDTDYSPQVYEVNVSYTTQSSDLTTGLTSVSVVTDNAWHHFAVSSDGSDIRMYLDGALDNNVSENRGAGFLNNDLTIGDGFNGTLDEFRIYDIALSPEQIANNNNTNYNTWVSNETSAGEKYTCSITPNDGEGDGLIKTSAELEVLVSITFNVVDSYSGASLNNVVINCNSTDFNQSGDTTNTYGPYGFTPGSYECTFIGSNVFDKSIIFTADYDRTVAVPMSEEAGISVEEHTWLEAVYNCVVGGDCALYDMISNINDTVTNIWEHTAPTDESVVLSETITNKVVNSTNNLTIDYQVYVPIKAGYSLGAYLPIRIGYFFLDDNENCYDQGDVQSGVNGPSCTPLMIETIGPMGGTVNFTVELQPALVSGDNYTIKRVIDIDPLGVWYNYGSEIIGDLTMLETLSISGVSVEKTSDQMPGDSENSENNDESSSDSSSTKSSDKVVDSEDSNVQTSDIDDEENFVSSITGAVVGAGKNILSGSQLVLIIAMLCITLVVVVLNRSKTKLKLSGH